MFRTGFVELGAWGRSRWCPGSWFHFLQHIYTTPGWALRTVGPLSGALVSGRRLVEGGHEAHTSLSGCCTDAGTGNGPMMVADSVPLAGREGSVPLVLLPRTLASCPLRVNKWVWCCCHHHYTGGLQKQSATQREPVSYLRESLCFFLKNRLYFLEPF